MNSLDLNLIVQVPNALGLVGTQIAGKKRRIGWLLGAAAEITWIIWSLFAGAWGVIPWCVAWGFVYVQNWWRWRTTARMTHDSLSVDHRVEHPSASPICSTD